MSILLVETKSKVCILAFKYIFERSGGCWECYHYVCVCVCVCVCVVCACGMSECICVCECMCECVCVCACGVCVHKKAIFLNGRKRVVCAQVVIKKGVSL